mgnify:CR=1 FL=1
MVAIVRYCIVFTSAGDTPPAITPLVDDERAAVFAKDSTAKSQKFAESPNDAIVTYDIVLVIVNAEGVSLYP